MSIVEHEVVDQRQPQELVALRVSSIQIELPGEVRISLEGAADPAAIILSMEDLGTEKIISDAAVEHGLNRRNQGLYGGHDGRRVAATAGMYLSGLASNS